MDTLLVLYDLLQAIVIGVGIVSMFSIGFIIDE